MCIYLQQITQAINQYTKLYRIDVNNNYQMNLPNLSHQIINNSAYILQLCTQVTVLTFKLNIKVSNCKTDVYQYTLSSLKDVEKLENSFQTLEDFKQYVKDTSNIEVALESKIIRILGTLQNKRIKKIIQLATIQLSFLKSVQINPQDQLINKILERCSQKTQLSGDVIKQFFQGVAISLNEFISQKRIIRQHYQLSQKKISILGQDMEILKKNFHQISQENQIKNQKLKKQYCQQINSIKLNISQNLQTSIHKTTSQIHQNAKLFKAEYQLLKNELRRLQAHKVNKPQMQKIKSNEKQIVLKIKQLEMVIQKNKKSIEVDVNALGLRLADSEKKLNQLPKKHAQIESQFNKKIAFYQKYSQIALKWLDPQSCHFNNLILTGSTITTKAQSMIISTIKIASQNLYSYTVIFKKICDFVSLGVVDTQYKKLTKFGEKQVNRIRYSNHTGHCWVGNDKKIGQNNGFKTGQPITVAVDTSSGVIQWKVYHDIRYQAKLTTLTDNKISWVPWILMGKGDCLMIVD